MNRATLLHSLKVFKEINKIKYRIKTIGIFGSYARDNADEHSDVDIVVNTETPDLFNIIHIKQDLEEQLQMPVDIIRLREQMNPFLKKRIEKEAIYV